MQESIEESEALQMAVQGCYLIAAVHNALKAIGNRMEELRDTHIINPEEDTLYLVRKELLPDNFVTVAHEGDCEEGAENFFKKDFKMVVYSRY